jgi:hypothetical protein
VNVHNLKPDATPRNIEHAASLSRKRTCLPYPRIIYVDRVSERPVEISFRRFQTRQSPSPARLTIGFHAVGVSHAGNVWAKEFRKILPIKITCPAASRR